MEAALLARLLATAGLTALVSTRINWTRRPQGEALPAVVLHLIDRGPDYHTQGASGLVENRVQVDCWASSYKSAKAVARAVEAAVAGQSFVQGAVRFDAVFLADERDASLEEAPETLFRTSLDLMVHHASAT